MYLYIAFLFAIYFCSFEIIKNKLLNKPSQTYPMVVYVNFCKFIIMFEAAMASEASQNVLLQNGGSRLESAGVLTCQF